MDIDRRTVIPRQPVSVYLVGQHVSAGFGLRLPGPPLELVCLPGPPLELVSVYLVRRWSWSLFTWSAAGVSLCLSGPPLELVSVYPVRRWSWSLFTWSAAGVGLCLPGPPLELVSVYLVGQYSAAGFGLGWPRWLFDLVSRHDVDQKVKLVKLGDGHRDVIPLRGKRGDRSQGGRRSKDVGT